MRSRLAAGRWSWTRGHETQLSDGTSVHVFRGKRLLERLPGLPEYWHPERHLFAPVKGYFWGRPQDDWWMRERVAVDGARATILLSRSEGEGEARLVVDVASRMLVEYARPSGTLSLVDAVVGPPLVSFSEPRPRCSDEKFLDEVRPTPPPPGTVRSAG